LTTKSNHPVRDGYFVDRWSHTAPSSFKFRLHLSDFNRIDCTIFERHISSVH